MSGLHMDLVDLDPALNMHLVDMDLDPAPDQELI